VNFSGVGSSDPDGSITAWAWDLDGDAQFDDSSAQTVSYQYSTPGTYAARLRVTDNQGAPTISQPLTISVASSATVVEKAQGKPATASSSERANLGPQYANDGKPNTRWSSIFADNQWWQVDLGSARTVDSVQVTFNRWAWPRTYSVSTSTDGTTWTVAATETLTTWGTRTSTFAVPSARYVRITGLTRGTSAGTSIEEAKVYGPAD
jgi:PKD repeat protein